MAESKDVLSVHETLATYQGTRHIPCRFMTSLCPDRCGHATDVAVFKIDEYQKYEKPGQYGDPEAKEFLWNLKPDSDANRIHPEYLEIVKGLQPGQKVKLNWTHFYVTNREGSKYPERSVTFFEKI